MAPCLWQNFIRASLEPSASVRWKCIVVSYPGHAKPDPGNLGRGVTAWYQSLVVDP